MEENDCLTKSKLDNGYGCRRSPSDDRREVRVCGLGDVSMGCAHALWFSCTCPDLRAAGMHGDIPGGRSGERRVGDRHSGAVNREFPRHVNNLCCTTDHLSFSSSWSFMNRVLAQPDVLRSWKKTSPTKNDVYLGGVHRAEHEGGMLDRGDG